MEVDSASTKRKRKRGGTCCADGLCSKRDGRDKSSMPGRKFLRFFRFPKDPEMRKKWTARIGRDVKYFKATDGTRICSDHFTDEDLDPQSIQRFLQNTDPEKKSHIKLLTDAVPNTDRLTGHYRRLEQQDATSRRILSVFRNEVSEEHDSSPSIEAPSTSEQSDPVEVEHSTSSINLDGSQLESSFQAGQSDLTLLGNVCSDKVAFSEDSNSGGKLTF